MTTATAPYARHGGTDSSPEYRGSTLARAEDWLDRKGKWAWITAMVLGFVFFWPLGLALLFYMIWGKKMFGRSCRTRTADFRARHGQMHEMMRSGRAAMRSSGNSAFDSYKADTLRRLEDEQEAFEAFLERLRAAKDKTEFDQFMDERASRAQAERRADAATPEAHDASA